MHQRGIDHLVHAVHGMDHAREVFARMGFTLTPVNVHPFGTFNSIVQLQGSFIELLAVEDPDLMPHAEPGAFNFPRFNFLYLERHEGVSMIVLESQDAIGDAKIFADLDIQTYLPFEFSRKAPQPDGSEPTVGFKLAFLSDPYVPETGFFVCQQLAPQYFWKEAFQTHANSAQTVEEVVMVAPEPVDMHRFLQGFTGNRDIRATSMGLEVQTPRGIIRVLTPRAAKTLWGDAIPVEEYETPRVAAYVIGVGDLATAEASLSDGDIDFEKRSGALIVPDTQGFGAAIAFKQVGGE